jgi:cyclophilin family peptidyl-prolyl cis-trans isomerase
MVTRGQKKPDRWRFGPRKTEQPKLSPTRQRGRETKTSERRALSLAAHFAITSREGHSPPVVRGDDPMKRYLPALLFLAVVACGSPETNKDTDKEVKEREEGEIKVELFEKEAPITVKNFLQYVDDKHYDGTIFHRVISDFMIQGGNYTKGFGAARGQEDLKRLSKSNRAPIRNEANNGVSNERGTIAMARTNDPNSATDQFFINVVDNSRKLDRNPRSAGYAVFGKVIDGMEFADKIRMVKTKEILGGMMENVPVDEVVIESIRREPAVEGKNPVVVIKVSKVK